MLINLKELKLLECKNKEYKKFIDNSYNEWTTNWKNINNKVEKNPWNALFEFEYKNKIGNFMVDTEGDYLTHMDLEGYLSGEEFFLEEGIKLKLASYSSNILVAIVFSESIRLGLIDEDEASYLSMLILPEWSRGLVPSDVLEEEDVKEFYEKTLIFLEKKGILVRHKIEINDFEIDSELEEKNEEFIKFVKDYMEKDLFFYVQNENLR